MTPPTVLIAGIGNIFLGDDAFGCEVLTELNRRQWPENIRMIDFGIRGFDLAYALLNGFDLVVLVDATPRGGAPGTLYTIEPELEALENLSPEMMAVETHGMDPLKVLSMVKSMGGRLKQVLLVGCEPETFGPEEGLMGLSESVQSAVPQAVRVIESIVANYLPGRIEVSALQTS